MQVQRGFLANPPVMLPGFWSRQRDQNCVKYSTVAALQKTMKQPFCLSHQLRFATLASALAAKRMAQGRSGHSLRIHARRCDGRGACMAHLHSCLPCGAGRQAGDAVGEDGVGRESDRALPDAHGGGSRAG